MSCKGLHCSGCGGGGGGVAVFGVIVIAVLVLIARCSHGVRSGFDRGLHIAGEILEVTGIVIGAAVAAGLLTLATIAGLRLTRWIRSRRRRRQQQAIAAAPQPHAFPVTAAADPALVASLFALGRAIEQAPRPDPNGLAGLTERRHADFPMELERDD